MNISDQRQYAPATARNREPILAVLQEVFPSQGTILEISSGTGEHATFFTSECPGWTWLPSDPNPVARASIAAWRSHSSLPNLYAPIALDVRDVLWPVERENLPPELAGVDLEQSPIVAIANINMIHISPWSACLGLMAGAGRILPPDGILYLYGPFKREGVHTAPSNASFDASLRSQNSEWGVRDLEEVIAVAQAEQFSLTTIQEMPANNLSVVFAKMTQD